MHPIVLGCQPVRRRGLLSNSPPTMRLLILLLLIKQVFCSIYSEEYESCRQDEDFGNTSLVCDPSRRLADETRQKLSDMLQGLQTRIGCECADGCRRADGRDGFIGLLHVTNSKNTHDLKADMTKEYADALLGNATCDHGLLLVYLKDTQKLATFRGGESFVLLTEEDMEKLHSLATKSQGAEGDNTLALQYLLSNYKDVVENPIQRAESLLPVLGLITAILIVLCITGVLLALFFARFCCCCSKRKKDVYHVNTIPTYKTIEPLYVVTPPTRHGNHAMSDAIYSTPYSGSPLPFFPHTNASPLSFPPPPRSSMPVTPTSTFRNTVNQETPIMKKKHTPRSEPGSLRRPGTGSDVYSIPPESIYGPRDIPVPTGVHDIYGTIPRVILSPRSQDSSQDPNDLPFLDPNRKQETQTREELIY